MTASTAPAAPPDRATDPPDRAGPARSEVLRELRPVDDDPVARTAAWVRRALDGGLLDLPSWASGDAAGRLAALTALGRTDLDLARLAEGHVDATAILAETGAGALASDRGLWGVWAANPPHDPLRAEPAGGGWLLTGSKPWCSGAGACDHALVTATAPDGYRLFAVDLPEPAAVGGPAAPASLRVVPGSWPATAMRGSDSRTIELERHPATAVGGPDDYLRRPGFWHGALGVAAVWLGGAQAVAAQLAAAAARRPLDGHALAHAGALDAALSAAEAVVGSAAAQVDRDPRDRHGAAHLWAARARAVTERAAAEAVDRVGRALGAAPLALDARHGQLVADLGLYVRQSHAERDLAELGRLALAEGGRRW